MSQLIYALADKYSLIQLRLLMQNKTAEYNSRSSKKKLTLKSALKLKNITLEEEHLLFRLNKKQQARTLIKNPHQSNQKSTRSIKKSPNQKNQTQIKSSQISLENSRSYQNFSNHKFQREDQREMQIWRPEYEHKQYNVDQIKSIIEREFKYFKLTGVIQKVYNLELNQQKNIKQRILSVAKKVVMNSQEKPTSSRSKQPFIKSHQTLKSILYQSMNKLYPVNDQKIGSKSKKEIVKLAQNYFNEINRIETFSNPTIDDLQLFGGKQNARKIQVKNFNEQSSALIVKNTFNQSQDLRLIEYFQKLFDLNREKYTMYANFLKYSTSYLNGNISKVAKQSNKTLINWKQNFQSDMQLLKGTIKNIILIHEKQHQNKCIHLEKFLKKIGYFKYMVNL